MNKKKKTHLFSVTDCGRVSTALKFGLEEKHNINKGIDLYLPSALYLPWSVSPLGWLKSYTYNMMPRNLLLIIDMAIIQFIIDRQKEGQQKQAHPGVGKPLLLMVAHRTYLKGYFIGYCARRWLVRPVIILPASSAHEAQRNILWVPSLIIAIYHNGTDRWNESNK